MLGARDARVSKTATHLAFMEVPVQMEKIEFLTFIKLLQWAKFCAKCY